MSEVLVLRGALGLEGIDALVGQLREQIAAASGPLQVDLSGVTDVDTAVLQVFLSARRMAVQAGKPLHFISANARLRERFRLTGLEFLTEAPPIPRRKND
ncbi:MAG: STAS domain-containing protein [Magnetococcales bacterium]|nr:STAS domain-containing protein [Magnetococcales bacterium]